MYKMRVLHVEQYYVHNYMTEKKSITKLKRAG